MNATLKTLCLTLLAACRVAGGPETRANSICEGANSVCDGTNSICEGTNSICEGANSVCEGANSVRDGTNSICAGANSICEGAGSICWLTEWRWRAHDRAGNHSTTLRRTTPWLSGPVG
ncbi:MAG: hypothetical protein ABL962_02275 [Fimbriimonadaceae bacterium]